MNSGRLTLVAQGAGCQVSWLTSPGPSSPGWGAGKQEAGRRDCPCPPSPQLVAVMRGGPSATVGLRKGPCR